MFTRFGCSLARLSLHSLYLYWQRFVAWRWLDYLRRSGSHHQKQTSSHAGNPQSCRVQLQRGDVLIICLVKINSGVLFSRVFRKKKGPFRLCDIAGANARRSVHNRGADSTARGWIPLRVSALESERGGALAVCPERYADHIQSTKPII